MTYWEAMGNVFGGFFGFIIGFIGTPAFAMIVLVLVIAFTGAATGYLFGEYGIRNWRGWVSLTVFLLSTYFTIATWIFIRSNDIPPSSWTPVG